MHTLAERTSAASSRSLQRLHIPSPAAALRRLQDHLLGSVAANSFSITNLVGTSPVPLLSRLETSSGLSQIGPFMFETFGNVKKFQEDTRVLLHWPTLVRSLPTLSFTNPTLALFFLGFRDIIRARAPFVFDVLQRIYAEDIFKSAAEPLKSNEGVSVVLARELRLHPVERSQLKRAIKALSSDALFISALQAAFHDAYIEDPPNIERRKLSSLQRTFPLLKTTLPIAMRRQCSLLYLESEAIGSGILSLVPPTPEDLPLLCRGNLTPLLEELWFAHGLSFPWNGRLKKEPFQDRIAPLGALLLIGGKQDRSRDTYLCINWELWLAYRTKKGKRKIYNTLIKAKAPLEDFRPTGVTSKDVLQKLRLGMDKKYTTLSSISTETMDNTMERCWGNIATRQTSIYSCTALRNISIKAYTARTSLKLNSPYESPRPPLAFVTLDCRVKLDKERSYYFQVVHTGRTVRIVPEWDMTNIRLYIPGAPHTERYFRPGIAYLPDGYTLSYSVKFLLSSEDSLPPGEGLKEKLKEFQGMTRKALLSLKNGKPAGYHPKWSKQEDWAIQTKYRPQMSAEAKAELSKVCSTRKPNAISGRARMLRKQLISQGVDDISLLPHGAYNASIGKEIEAAKKRAK